MERAPENIVVAMREKKKRRCDRKIILLSVLRDGSSDENRILTQVLAAEGNDPEDENGDNEDGNVEI